MTVDWRGPALGLLMAIGGALMGYAYGHHEGGQDSDSHAMVLFFDRCMVRDMPPACAQMFDALNSTWADDAPADPSSHEGVA